MSSFENLVVNAYKNFSNDVYRIIQGLRLDPNFATSLRQKEADRLILNRIGRFEDELIELFTNNIISEYLDSAERACHESGIEMFCSDSHDDECISNIVEDFSHRIKSQSRKILLDIKRILRIELNDIQRLSTLDSISRKDASKRLLGKRMSNDLHFNFIDRTGRKLGAERYFSMLANAAMLNAGIDGFVNGLICCGNDLVCVCDGSNDGAILSITGNDERFDSLADRFNDIFHPSSIATLKIHMEDDDAV